MHPIPDGRSVCHVRTNPLPLVAVYRNAVYPGKEKKRGKKRKKERKRKKEGIEEKKQKKKKKKKTTITPSAMGIESRVLLRRFSMPDPQPDTPAKPI
jgi:hypothetical protein